MEITYINQYTRVAVVSIDEARKFIGEDLHNSFAKRRLFKDVMVKPFSQRYEVFFEKGCTCEECGLKGSYFALEKSPGTEGPNYHMNLYGIDSNGDEIMLTKDHIIPKSLGGRNHFSNYRTLCFPCNQKKGNKVE